MRRNWIFSLMAGCVFFSLVLLIINNLLSDRMETLERSKRHAEDLEKLRLKFAFAMRQRRMTRNGRDPAIRDLDNLYEEFKLQDTVLEHQMGNDKLPGNDDPKANPWTGLIIKTSPFPFLTPKPGPNLTPPPKNKDFVEPPHRKLKTYPTFDVQGNVIYQAIDDPVPIDFDDGVNYEQYNDQEQGMMTETTDNVPVSTREERQQLRQGLINVDAMNMLKSVHGDDQDTNYKYNDINPVL